MWPLFCRHLCCRRWQRGVQSVFGRNLLYCGGGHGVRQLLGGAVLFFGRSDQLHQLLHGSICLFSSVHRLPLMSCGFSHCYGGGFTVPRHMYSRLLCCSRSICVHRLSTGHGLRDQRHHHSHGVSARVLLSHPFTPTAALSCGLLLSQREPVGAFGVRLLRVPPGLQRARL